MDVCTRVAAAGGRALLVGGCVRDGLAGIPTRDYDVEVYGLPADALTDLLAQGYSVHPVGRSFGVHKLKGTSVDVSLPRRDSLARDVAASSKRVNPHTAFDIETNRDLTVEEAAARRDFTINAMAYDPLADELIDPFGGREDLTHSRLRHTSDEHFAEDPLRVLRGMQFVARFELVATPETVALCRGIDTTGLSSERVFEEWRKLILYGRRISSGLEFLRQCGQLDGYPELAALIGCEQDPRWHPEGDVWIHTLSALDFFAAHRSGDEYEDLVVGLAVLCHDFGKPATTKRDGDRVRSHGHANLSVELGREFLGRMTARRDLIEDVVVLAKYHGVPREFHDNQVSAASVRRLSRKVGRIDRLVRVSLADSMGRPPISKVEEQRVIHNWLLDRARELEVARSAPEPLLLGRHVLALGVRPGPLVGRIVRACYELQLDGRIITLGDAQREARKMIEAQSSEESD